MNNVLYVIILSSALDLVGPSIPKSLVLLFDVLPSLITKLVAPYLLHLIPYNVRIVVLVVIPSACGMLLIALSPGGGSSKPGTNTSTIAIKMVGVMLASFASGAGELTFLGLTHYYGRWSLAAWGSGTGAAGLVGAGAYVAATTWIGLSVRTSLLVFSALPLGLLVCWFGVLPKGPLLQRSVGEYQAVSAPVEPSEEHSQDQEADDIEEIDNDEASQLMTRSSSNLIASEAHSVYHLAYEHPSFAQNLARVKKLLVPYMAPLFLVYLSEYLINQAVSPTLLFPLSSSPFSSYRAFYPTYAAIYQFGVFISRSSIAFVRIHNLYLPSFLQLATFIFLTLHALFNFIPSVWIVFAIIFWEGLLGGLVYVSTFAEITDQIPPKDREFSLSATSVSDSAGICLAGILGMPLEVLLCRYQVAHGRDYCKKL
jgi:battenin